MTTIQSILSRLTKAVGGTEKMLYTEPELNKFAELACRRCSECGRLMRAGYCADMGVAYYCSDECLHSDFTDEEWAEECENNDQSYYTEW